MTRLVTVKKIADLDAVKDQIVRPLDYELARFEIPQRQEPPNEQWCVVCTPDPDVSPGVVCSGCGPIRVEVRS